MDLVNEDLKTALGEVEQHSTLVENQRLTSLKAQAFRGELIIEKAHKEVSFDEDNQRDHVSVGAMAII